MTVEQSVATAASPAQQSKDYKKNTVSVAKGGGIVASGRLYAYGARFVLAFLLARAFGADQYGLYTLALSTATIVAGVAVFGLHTAMVRYVAILNKQEDEEGVWGALQLGLGLSTILSAVLATALFAFSYVIADGIYHRPELALLLQLIALIVPFMTMNIVLTGATHGFKKMKYTVIAQQLVQLTLRIVLTLILIVIGMKAIHAVAIFGVATIVAAILMVYFLNKEFSLRRSLRLAKHNRREILSFSFPVWISGLIRTFRSNIQIILLGSLYTAAGVGIFTVVGRVNLIGKVAYGSINTSARPIIAEIHSQGDRAQLGNIYHTTGRWATTVNLPIFLTLVLFSEAILSIFGRDFVNGATAMRILAVAELILVVTGTCGAIIDMTGHTRAKLFNAFVQLGLAIGLNVLLIPRWGIIGAAVGTLISITVVNLLRVAQVGYFFRIWPVNRTIVKPFLAALAALGAALLTMRLAPDDLNLLLLILRVAVLFAVYIGVLLLLGLPEEEKGVVASLKERLGHSRFARWRPGRS